MEVNGKEPSPAQLEPPTRWELELEFVQSLANPQYLNFLAQSKYLDQAEFLNYLDYLSYWHKPEYARYLVYPNCLHILRLLKQPLFRQEIQREDVAKMFMDDYYMKWLGEENAANLHGAQAPQPPATTDAQ